MTQEESTRDDTTPTCEVEPDVLWDLIDDLLSVDRHAEVEQHVAACARCQARIAKIRRVHSGLESITEAWQQPLPESIGPYRIRREIGAGGMGVVYEAEQEIPARSIALKVIHPTAGTDERRLRAFRREIQALGRMSHPGIATVHDAGRSDDGQLYLVMELVAGQSIDGYCDDNELGTRDRVALVVELANAVHYAHERGIIHRDLKPANILVDDTGRPRVLDFGLARFLDPSQDVTISPSAAAAAPSGTLPYMSPEQLAGDAISINVPTDVYALGVMLYQLLTGRLPYAMRDSLSEALRTVREMEPEHPSAVRSGLARELGDVVLKAIAKDPALRYATAGALAADLRRFLAGEAVTARPPSLVYRSKVFVRRHRQALGVSALLSIATSVGILSSRDGAARTAPRSTISIPDIAVEFAVHGRQFDFTSDGTALVHISDPDSRSFYLWDRTTQVTKEVQIEGEPGWFYHSPRWSPNRHSIAALGQKNVQDNASGGIWGVFLLDPDSGETTELRRVEDSEDQAHDLCWTPDGEALTFFNRKSEIYTLPLRGEARRWHGVYKPGMRYLGGYSPDGHWLLVDFRNDEDGSAVWNIPFGGGRAVQLTHDPGFEQHSVFSTSGDAVFYVAADPKPGSKQPKNAFNAFRLAVDRRSGRPTDKPEQLTHERNSNVFHPRPLGDDLALHFVQRSSLIYSAENDDFEKGRALTKGYDPMLSGDGETVFFTGDIEEPGLYAMPRDGRSKRKLADRIVSDRNHYQPDYEPSPDGREIAYRSENGGTFTLCVVATSGAGPTRVLDEFDTMPGVPRWSPDGSLIAFAIGGAIHVIAAADGKPREPIGQMWSWDWIAWSPRGDAIAGLGYLTPSDEKPENDRNALFVVSFPDGELRQVSKDPEYKETFAWHPTRNFLSYYSYGSPRSGSQIRFVYPDAGRDLVAIAQKDHWDFRGVWYPDGERFLFWSKGNKKHDECNSYHVYTLEQNRVTKHGVPGLDDADFPRFCATGSVAVWEKLGGQEVQSFTVLHGGGR